jgi:hypothetical protein
MLRRRSTRPARTSSPWTPSAAAQGQTSACPRLHLLEPSANKARANSAENHATVYYNAKWLAVSSGVVCSHEGKHCRLSRPWPVCLTRCRPTIEVTGLWVMVCEAPSASKARCDATAPPASIKPQPQRVVDANNALFRLVCLLRVEKKGSLPECQLRGETCSSGLSRWVSHLPNMPPHEGSAQ